MRGTEGLYRLLVDRVPEIRKRYQTRREQVSGFGRVGLWAELLGWNIEYAVSDGSGAVRSALYEKKQLPKGESESALSARVSPDEFADSLSDFDTIAFDVFDTLVFRPFSNPEDIFYLMGERLEYPDFRHIRCEAEYEAREEKYKREGNREVSVSGIYKMLEAETGINADTAACFEKELQCRLCFANPYMKQVVKTLAERGKRLIVVSDMYLDEQCIRRILKQCGYDDFDAYYVSCEYGESKSTGDLFDTVKEIERASGCEENKIAIVGDNDAADVRRAKEHGFTPFYYPNVNNTGAAFRAEDISSITGSVYRGIVNAHIYNGLYKFSREYEFGYIYGGLFVTGYCQWIHEYAHRHDIDKILFLSRDGDILSKAYHILYPEEGDSWEYVYWSRRAALKLAADKYRYEYFRRFIHHKINQDYTLEQIFAVMELKDMLDEVCDHTGLTAEAVLTDKNERAVCEYLNENWDRVSAHYEDQRKAGKAYWQKVLNGCDKAAAVDIGWAGSGAVMLRYMVKDVWNIDCDITGLIAGTNTANSAESDTSETFLRSGMLVSYMYSQDFNRDLWKFHDAGKDHNLFFELITGSEEGNFIGFYPDENGGTEIRIAEPTADTQRIKRIQKGILDFVRGWERLPGDLKNLASISGRDAYSPMMILLQDNNSAYRSCLKDMLDEANIG